MPCSLIPLRKDLYTPSVAMADMIPPNYPCHAHDCREEVPFLCVKAFYLCCYTTLFEQSLLLFIVVNNCGERWALNASASILALLLLVFLMMMSTAFFFRVFFVPFYFFLHLQLLMINYQ
jgi:hypothetical protein